MTQEDYLKIKEGLDSAQADVTPFPVVKDGEISIIGDANKTEINKNDYTIQFKVPNGVVPDGVGRKTPTGTYLELDYKDIFVTPRQEYDVTRILIKIMPYFRKVDENGEVSEYTDEEAIQILLSMEDELADLMYDLVAKVCGVDPALKDYMLPTSVVVNTYKIAQDIPNSINEAETFFTKSARMTIDIEGR